MNSRQRALLGLLLASVTSFSVLIGCETGGETAILDLDPRAGATQGEQPVKILGQNFRPDIGYTVYFGVKRAGQVVIADPNTLLVATPSAEEAGDVDISIRADDGHAWRITKGFRYENMAGSVMQNVGDTNGAPTKGRF